MDRSWFGECVLLALFVAWPQGVAAQPHLYTGDRVVDILDLQARENGAVMLTKVTVRGMEVQCGLLANPQEVQPVTPFRADDDWLRNTTIFLFNRTNKVIVAGSLIALFPQTGDGKTKPYRGCGMYFGRRPDVDSIDGRTGKPIAQDPSRTPLSWQPGQYLEVHVGDYIDGIQVQLKPAMALKDVNWLRIHIGAFFFEDGMRWMGTFAVPDPDRPGKFKNMPDDYYPGNRYINWPPRERN